MVDAAIKSKFHFSALSLIASEKFPETNKKEVMEITLHDRTFRVWFTDHDGLTAHISIFVSAYGGNPGGYVTCSILIQSTTSYATRGRLDTAIENMADVDGEELRLRANTLTAYSFSENLCETEQEKVEAAIEDLDHLFNGGYAAKSRTPRPAIEGTW